MCVTPITIFRKYNTLKGDKSDIVPCGKCPECLGARQRAWAFRLEQEMKVSESAAFVTLTYKDEPQSFNGHGTLQKSDLTKFWKRLRKNRDVVKPIKYFACGEYGKHTLRPHYHAIIYNLPHAIIQNSDRIASDIWQAGMVHVGACNMASINYTLKYITKGSWQPEQDDDDRQPQFQTMSKNLGKSYLTPQMVKYHVEGLIPYVTKPGGIIQALPRYYKDKIFSKTEKLKIAYEARLRNEMDWEEFANKDFRMEVLRAKDCFEKAAKKLKYENLTL